MIIDGFEGEQGFIRLMLTKRYMATDSIQIRNALIDLKEKHKSDRSIDEICGMFFELIRDDLEPSDAYFIINAKLANKGRCDDEPKSNKP